MFVSKFLLKFNQSFQGFKIWGYFRFSHGESESEYICEGGEGCPVKCVMGPPVFQG